MRPAGHLGVRAADAPLLRHVAGSADPVAQIACLAAHGFAGVSDNHLMLRPAAEQARIGAAVVANGMAMGSFVHDPLRWDRPTWSNAAWREAIGASLEAAVRSGSRTINCVTGRDPAMTAAGQRAAMAAQLRVAGGLAAQAGVVLVVEATHPAFAPGLLVERWWEAVEIVAAADHPAVRINLDIGHVALHGDDPVTAIHGAAQWIGMVQAADVPGRVEPGAGRLDWRAIAAALDEVGYAGLVELELEPAEAGEAGERLMLARLVASGLLPDQNEKPTSTP